VSTPLSVLQHTITLASKGRNIRYFVGLLRCPGYGPWPERPRRKVLGSKRAVELMNLCVQSHGNVYQGRQRVMRAPAIYPDRENERRAAPISV
jgi:hypothetical protein